MEEVTTKVKTIRIRKAGKVGFSGLRSYPYSVTTLGCQIGKSGFKTGLTKVEEEHYEKLLDLKPGTLSKHSPWWGEVFNVKYAIRLKNTKTNDLIIDNPINELKYKCLLEHSRIANSEVEQYKPGVLFYIDDPEAKAKEELKVINFRFEGMKLIMNMSGEDKKAALRLFDKIGVDGISEDMASNQLYIEMERDPKRFYDIMTDEELKTKAWIYELVEKSLIKRKGLYFIHNDETIANNINECVEYFKNPKHQTVKLALETKLRKDFEPKPQKVKATK